MPSDSLQSQVSSNPDEAKTASIPVEQTTIGRSLVIKGEVSNTESLYIDGRIQGTVNFAGHRVTYMNRILVIMLFVQISLGQDFVGMDINRLDHPWPTTSGVPFASWRTLGSANIWATMNPSNGTYNFSTFDQWMLRAQSSGQDVMFTAFSTPSWASSRGSNCVSMGSPAGCLGPPNTSCAFNSIYGPGLCDPPNDINCDGSGTDQHFINFVNALLNHVGPGKIKYWEMWNEPNVSKEWNADADCPSTPHANQLILARMAHDLRTTVSAIDSNALFTTPAAANSLTNVSTWMNSYFTYTNGATFADIIAFHGYIQTGQCPSDCPIPEHVLTLIGKVKAVIPAGQQSKPLFDTEGSWGGVPGGANGITDPDQQAAFLGRYFLLQMGAGISKLYWYGWDFTGSGFLYDPNTHSLTLAGNAYKQIVNWTSGKNVQPCVSNSTQWSCAIGTDTKAIWDTSQTCGSASCTTTNVSVPLQFTSYIDLSGTTRPVTNSVVPVGAKPILLVSSSISQPAPPTKLTGVVH